MGLTEWLPADLGCQQREGDHKGRPYEREAVAPEGKVLFPPRKHPAPPGETAMLPGDEVILRPGGGQRDPVRFRSCPGAEAFIPPDSQLLEEEYGGQESPLSSAHSRLGAADTG